MTNTPASMMDAPSCPKCKAATLGSDRWNCGFCNRATRRAERRTLKVLRFTLGDEEFDKARVVALQQILAEMKAKEEGKPKPDFPMPSARLDKEYKKIKNTANARKD